MNNSGNKKLLFIEPFPFFQNERRAKCAKIKVKGELMYKGENLLAYDGPTDDYGAIGRFLARKMFTFDERAEFCWFGQRSNANCVGRKMASKEDEWFFKGSIFCSITMLPVFFVSSIFNCF